MSRASALWRRVLWVGTLALLGELAARVGATTWSLPAAAAPFEPESWFVYSEALGWERRPGFDGAVDGSVRSFDATGFLTIDSAQASSAAARPIVFVGSDNTAGFGVPAESTFVEEVERRMIGTPAINLGVRGYSSLQMRRLLEHAIERLRPSVVVLEPGRYDSRAVGIGDSPDGDAHFKTLNHRAHASAPRLLRWVDRFYVYRAGVALARSVGLAAVAPDSVEVESLVPRVSTDDLASNITAINDLCKRTGCSLVLLLTGDSPFETRELREGIRSFAAGDMTRARAFLRVPFELGRDLSFDGLFVARKYTAATFRAERDTSRARATSIVPRPVSDLFGRQSLDLDTVYLEAARRAADQMRVPIVSGSSLVAEHPELVADRWGHLSIAGHRALAAMLADTIARLSPIQP